MTTPAPSPSVIRLDEVGSTNSYLASHRDALPHGTVVTARSQSAGRGQRGNSWEAARGLNITMSILLRPEGILPREQFVISEAVSLAITELLDGLLPPEERISIKWPNDIYVGDRKICGILIEHTLAGNRIESTIAGIGLNVNQREFLSDAPNPVSLWQLTGHEYEVESLTMLLSRLVLTILEADRDELHRRYRQRLWRRDTPSRYRDTASGELFEAVIADVEPDGMLSLRLADGSLRRYAFKEVAFIL